MIQQSDARPLTLQRSHVKVLPFCIQATVGLVLQIEDLAAASLLWVTESIFMLVEQTDGGWRRIKTCGCEGQFNFLQQEDELQPMGDRHLGFTSELGFPASYLLMYRAGLKQRKAPSSDIYMHMSHTHSYKCLFQFSIIHALMNTSGAAQTSCPKVLDWTDRRIQESNHQPSDEHTSLLPAG